MRWNRFWNGKEIKERHCRIVIVKNVFTFNTRQIRNTVILSELYKCTPVYFMYVKGHFYANRAT